MDGRYGCSPLIVIMVARDGSCSSRVGTPYLRFHLSASGDEIALQDDEGRVEEERAGVTGLAPEGLDASSEGRHEAVVGTAIEESCRGRVVGVLN